MPPGLRRTFPSSSAPIPQITEIYYYRWKLYKSHLKDLGERGYIVTEFLDDVGWSLKPYESLNDATAFHIHEGRWLRDRRYVDDYIDFMYHGGNDRHFSEAIAAAVYDRYLVDGDRAFATKNLDAMKRIYQHWDDHYDASKGLYFIEPLLDATEYTISSIDATGGQGRLHGRRRVPSHHQQLHVRQRARHQPALGAGRRPNRRRSSPPKPRLSADRSERPVERRASSTSSTATRSTTRTSITGTSSGAANSPATRPGISTCPTRSPNTRPSWSHLLSPDQLGGPYGLRTVEPSYQYYMRQYRYAQEDG